MLDPVYAWLKKVVAENPGWTALYLMAAVAAGFAVILALAQEAEKRKAAGQGKSLEFDPVLGLGVIFTSLVWPATLTVFVGYFLVRFAFHLGRALSPAARQVRDREKAESPGRQEKKS